MGTRSTVEKKKKDNALECNTANNSWVSFQMQLNEERLVVVSLLFTFCPLPLCVRVHMQYC